MKKLLLVISMVLGMVAVVMAGSISYSGSVNATTQKVLLAATGTTFTAVNISETYFPLTYTPSTVLRFYLEDASNTWTASAAKVTLTAVPITGTNEPPCYCVGASGLQTNSSGNGLWTGIPFYNGIVLDGGTDAANSSSTTITAVIVGK
jgi:hypothetical protein